MREGDWDFAAGRGADAHPDGVHARVDGRLVEPAGDDEELVPGVADDGVLRAERIGERRREALQAVVTRLPLCEDMQ